MAPESSLDSRRILIVDDDVDSAAIVQELLEDSGYVAAVAHNESEAVARAIEFHPAVVLLDLHLPPTDGYAVCRRLTTLQPAPRVIAVTGDLRQGEAHLKEQGFAALVCKPIDLPRLFQLLGGTSC